MHQIRYFVVLARTLNFTRAAEECNVTQPSLTRAIKLLEHELGCDLLRRERGLTHLTDLGRRMLPLLTKCHESAVTARATAEAIRAGGRATLRLAAPSGVALAPFAPHLSELLAAFEGLGLEVRRGDAMQTAEALRQGEVELAVAEPAAMGWERFESWPLFREPMTLVARRDDLRPPKADDALDAAAAARLILRRGCAAAEGVEAALVARGHDLDAAIRVATDADAVALATQGAGVALVPLSTPAHAMRRLSLDDRFGRELRFYAVQGRRREPPAAMLVTQMRAADWEAYLGAAAAEIAA